MSIYWYMSFAYNKSQKTIYPDCLVYLVPRNKYVGVDIIDNEGCDYLSYLLMKYKQDLTLFLQKAWFYQIIPGNSNENQEYRMHFAFNQDGTYAARKYIDFKRKYENYEVYQKLDFQAYTKNILNLANTKAYFNLNVLY